MNTLVNNPYYMEMLKRNRLIPFFVRDKKTGEDKLFCIITFYIGNKVDEDKFVRDDMWSVLPDDINGNICFIDQWLKDQNYKNFHSYEIWYRFKEHIKNNFPLVKTIRWNRWNRKTNIVKTYKKEVVKWDKK